MLLNVAVFRRASRASRGEQVTSKPTGCRVATLNVSLLQPRFYEIMMLCKKYDIDVLCLQETRETRHSKSGTAIAARKHGYQMLTGHTCRDIRGSPTGTNVIFSRWPCRKLAHPAFADYDRVQFITLHAPGDKAMVLGNVHLPHNDIDASRLLDASREFLAKTGLRKMLIGDFNQIPSSNIIASVEAANDLAVKTPVDKRCNPTCRPTHGGVGRHIDYLMTASSIGATYLEQVLGPADHDLVIYDIATKSLEPTMKWAAVGSMPALGPDSDDDDYDADFLGEISDDKWRADIGTWWHEYVAARDAGDIDMMWTLLSNCGERLLGVGSKTNSAVTAIGGRAEARKLVPREAIGKGAEQVGSLKFRQLIKLRAVVREYLLDLTDVDARRSMINKCANLCEYDDLFGNFNPRDPSHINRLDILIENLRQFEGGHRLLKWKGRMLNDSVAREWIKRDPAEEDTCMANALIHPQDKVEEYRDKFAKLYLDTPPEPELVDKYLGFIPNGGYEGATRNGYLEPVKLALRAKRQAKKAQGLDGWKPADVARLPIGWYKVLADVFATMLAVGKVPANWCAVRICLIPKHDGTGDKRGLGIAAFAWRLCMSELLSHHNGWICNWLHPDIASGPGRSAENLLDNLLDDLGDPSKEVVGAKIDLSKCFDRLSIARGCRILIALGFDPAIADILLDFYRQVYVHVECEGAISKDPLKILKGLLQGCPVSVLIMLAEDTCWAHFVNAHSTAKAGAYFDDRSIWSEDSAEVRKAVDASWQFDKDAGWLWNHKKGQLFGGKRKLAELADLESRVGPAGPTVELLGITATVDVPDKPVLREKASVKVPRELDRIRIGLSGSSPVQTRRRHRMVAQLIIPKISWGGHWQLPKPALVRKWGNQVEITINGPRIGRSNALAWCALGGKLNPEFALDFKVFSHEMWRARRNIAGFATGSRRTRLDTVLRKYNWTALPNEFGATLQFVTRHGILDLARDGAATIQAACEDAWRHTLFLADNRSKDDASVTMLEASVPCTKQHCVWLRNGSQAMKRAAVASSFDYRALTNMKHKGVPRADRPNLLCSCGFVNPDRRHLVWDCPVHSIGAELQDPPQCPAEHGLLLRMMPTRAVAPPRHKIVDRVLAESLVTSCKMLTTHSHIIACSDGACEHPTDGYFRIASWGAAVLCKPSFSQAAYTASAGHCEGLDQTSTAAEITGALRVLRAAQAVRLHKPLAIFVDNRTAQRGIDRVLRGLPVCSRHYFGLWADAKAAANSLHKGTRCFWVPAHKRHKDWTPPAGLTLAGNEATLGLAQGDGSSVLTDTCYPVDGAPEGLEALGQLIRSGNDEADNVASQVCIGRWSRERLAEFDAHAGANKWSSLALSRLLAAEDALMKLHLPEL